MSGVPYIDQTPDVSDNSYAKGGYRVSKAGLHQAGAALSGACLVFIVTRRTATQVEAVYPEKDDYGILYCTRSHRHNFLIIKLAPGDPVRILAGADTVNGGYD